MAADNKSLGKFVLDGIPPAPRGVPQVEVTFDVDSNGVLNVTAKDKSTGKEQSIRIEANSGLTEEDIEKMKKDAEDHAAEDGKKKELIEVRNQAEQTIYTAQKALKDHEKEIPEEVKTEIEDKIKELNEVKEKDDKTAIDTVVAALSTSLQKIGEIMQKAAEAATKDGAEANPDTAEETTDKEAEPEVRDAEEVKNEEAEEDKKEDKKEDK
jgi:molecular chaperone DnaK